MVPHHPTVLLCREASWRLCAASPPVLGRAGSCACRDLAEPIPARQQPNSKGIRRRGYATTDEKGVPRLRLLVNRTDAVSGGTEKGKIQRRHRSSRRRNPSPRTRSIKTSRPPSATSARSTKKPATSSSSPAQPDSAKPRWYVALRPNLGANGIR